MHKVSANYTLPTVLKTLKPPIYSGPARAVGGKVTPSTTGTTGTSTSASSSSTSDSLSTTFLSLLSQELQNQDPTAPVDSTAMVGQMISLNQLDQLININQTLTGSSTPTTAGGLQQAAASAASGAVSPLSPSVAGAAANQLPFDPNTMMPLTSTNSGAVAAAINSSLNAATIGLSGTNTNTSGGK